MLFNGVTLSSISQLLLKTKIILGSQKQEMGGWGGGGLQLWLSESTPMHLICMPVGNKM